MSISTVPSLTLAGTNTPGVETPIVIVDDRGCFPNAFFVLYICLSRYDFCRVAGRCEDYCASGATECEYGDVCSELCYYMVGVATRFTFYVCISACVSSYLTFFCVFNAGGANTTYYCGGSVYFAYCEQRVCDSYITSYGDYILFGRRRYYEFAGGGTSSSCCYLFTYTISSMVVGSFRADL